MTAPTSVGSPFVSGANVANGVLTLTTPVSVGQILYVTVAAGGTGLTMTCEDTKGNSWDHTASVTVTTTPSTSQIFWTKITVALSAGDQITVRRTAGGNGGLSFAAASLPTTYSATLRDSDSNSSNVSNNAPATPSVTVDVGDVVVMALSTNISRTITAVASGYVQGPTYASTGGGNPRLGFYEYAEISVAGTSTPGATLSSGNTWTAISVVFQLAPSNQDPVSVAGSDARVRDDASAVILDGTSSADPDGTISSYSWTQTSGTAVTLSNASTATASFAPPDGRHTLVFQLEVEDDDGATDIDTVTIEVLATPTLAIIGNSLTERAEDHAAPPTREAVTRALAEAAGYHPDSIYWHARGGKTLTTADSSGTTTPQNVVEAQTQLGGGVDHWLMELGTNNATDAHATFSSRVVTVLDSIYLTGSEADQVFWPNLAAMNPANSTYNDINPVLASTLASYAHADKIRLLDWYTYSHLASVYDDDDWLPSDVPHMTVQGYAKRDNYLIGRLLKAMGNVKVWDGSNWAFKPLKTWNGTSWVQKPVKTYDGGTWS